MRNVGVKQLSLNLYNKEHKHIVNANKNSNKTNNQNSTILSQLSYTLEQPPKNSTQPHSHPSLVQHHQTPQNSHASAAYLPLTFYSSIVISLS
jgi:hypothetical protein